MRVLLSIINTIILAGAVASAFFGLAANVIDDDPATAAMHYACAAFLMIAFRLDGEPR